MATHLDTCRVIIAITGIVSALCLSVLLTPSLFLSLWRGAVFIGEYPDIPPDIIEALKTTTASRLGAQEIDWDQALKMWGGGE